MCMPQIASHVMSLIQKLTAEKMLAASADQFVTAVVAAVTFQAGAIIVFDSLQPKPSFIREDSLVNREPCEQSEIPANKELVLPTIASRQLI